MITKERENDANCAAGKRSELGFEAMLRVV